MKDVVYQKVREFKKKYPLSISWRLRKHCDIINMHLNPGEKVVYAFTAQKNDNPLDIITTNVIVLTNERILLGQKRLLFGYFFTAITPDLFNDLKVNMGIIWGKIYIDTIKELVTLSNIQKEALPEIETNITRYMMEEKKKYFAKNKGK
ncbi:MAG: PH domain-containing protein [Bacilli bacterium]|nr:PH domain-containing protein [Bacilli bacterium]